MLWIYYLLFIGAGFIVAYLYGKSTRKFLWREYWVMFIAPAIGFLLLVYYFGIAPAKVLIIGAAGLTALEWLTGYAYHKIVGSRLWRYERYAFPGGYSSWLSIPFWGFGAVILWLIFTGF